MSSMRKFLVFREGEFVFVDDVDLLEEGNLVLGLYWFLPGTLFKTYSHNEQGELSEFLDSQGTQGINILKHLTFVHRCEAA